MKTSIKLTLLIITILFTFSNSTFCIQNSKIKILPGDTVFKRVDVIAKYKGGAGALYKFIDANLKYPEEATQKKMEGKVVVKFIVDRNGKVSNPTLFRGVNKLLDDEALRVIGLLPNWIPGQINGKPVPSYVQMPVHFKLKK